MENDTPVHKEPNLHDRMHGADRPPKGGPYQAGTDTVAEFPVFRSIIVQTGCSNVSNMHLKDRFVEVPIPRSLYSKA